MLKRKIMAFASAILIAFSAFASLALAQQQNEDGGNGLQISPTRTEINLLPGEKKSFSFLLKNITSGEIKAEAVINDFESDGVTGNPQIIVDINERTPTTISNFVSGLQDYDLKPGEEQQVNLTVDVPENAAPGAYFGVVRYLALPKKAISEAERQLALTASVAHLVLIEVTGEINKQIQIESLKMQRDNSASSIFFKSPNKAALAIKNLGNGFSRPFGTVTINNMFGKEVFNYEPNNSQPKGVVLPKSSRVFIDSIEGVKTPGRYTATASMAHGNGGEVISYKSSFWYLPAWFLLAVLVLIALIGGGGYYLYKKKYASSKSRRKSRR
ncbi:hypothetical protein KY385_03765 [Candidatus Parcubacteria bacterium]|nr:hypothetical protein [Candidatus Parcubacteria bacterium]